MPSMTEQEATRMVDSLISAAQTAAMHASHPMPPTVALAVYQRLEAERRALVNALMTANAGVQPP